ncbi:MAG TPA: HK97 family phage prohead protease [Thermodesulfobacteriota bacterium]|nr:HK97 family phage prohead protease [Thermodesulfobacteriota bacterium]
MRNEKLFYRDFEIDSRAINKEKRSVELSFSSEEPVRRWGASEILLHGEGNVDLSRLKKMGSALLNHNANIIVGRITEARLEDKKGKAIIVFDDDEDGNRAMKKVESGSLKGVSVGYMINKAREVRVDEEWEGYKGPAYIATRWTPYEISLTPIPADATVGVGRSLEGIEIERTEVPNTKPEESTMEEKDVQRIVETALEKERAALPGLIATAVKDAMAEENKPKMRITVEQFDDLSNRASAISPEAELEVSKLARSGKTEVEIQKYLLDLRTGKADAGNTTKGTEGEQGKKVTDEDRAKLVRSLKSPRVAFAS